MEQTLDATSEADDWESEWNDEKLLEDLEKLKVKDEDEKKEEEKPKPKIRKGRGSSKFHKEDEELGTIQEGETLSTLQPLQNGGGNYKESINRDKESPSRRPTNNTTVAKRIIGNILQIDQLAKARDSKDDERKSRRPGQSPKKDDYWDGE
eukprot:TRINITY_DN23578_c0_g1_i1.p2 TRINITY_DN23578_c0_g1~~TRINITY_DN23578_c0_g1_i1.p2  ORF type:complete len:151 (+),score=51.39 TRINITY_DN23578_c0_g1_i1:69-521(+)